MRPEVQKIGVCTTATPVMVGPNGVNYFDASNYRRVAIQLVQTPGGGVSTWTAGTVDIQASLDGGVTWSTVITAPTGYGFVVLPDVVFGRVRASGNGLSALASIDVWFSGMNARSDY